MSATSTVRELFTRKDATYERFISLVRYPQGIRAFFLSSPLLRAEQRVLDAGCGTGVITLALWEALTRRGFSSATFHAFDLTPAMLERFRAKLAAPGAPIVDLATADVLQMTTLPARWTDFDLIVTASMLEYVARQRLAEALANLRQRLNDNGTLILFITKRNWLTRPLVGMWWRSNLYDRRELESAFHAAGFSRIEFARFPAAGSYLRIWGHIVIARNRG
jgi:ubiquinone/menaquinone biosynthesis C-methylase UbiE